MDYNGQAVWDKCRGLDNNRITTYGVRMELTNRGNKVILSTVFLCLLAYASQASSTVIIYENNITSLSGNATFLYFCNSTDCKTLTELATDTDTDTTNSTV